MTSITDVSTGVRANIETTMLWYNASDSMGPPPGTYAPPSGAYIFRPNGEFVAKWPVFAELVEGPVVTEIRQVCGCVTLALLSPACV